MTDNTTQPTKLSVTWLELLFIALFVTLGLGLWGFIENQVIFRLADQKPQAHIYELNEFIPTLQSTVDGTTVYLNQLYGEMAGLQSQEREAKTEQMFLVSAYPFLVSLSFTNTLSLDIETIQAHRKMQQDVAELGTLVAELETAITEVISDTADLSISLNTLEPNTVVYESAILRHAERKVQLEAYQDRLIEKRLEYLQRRAEMGQLVIHLSTLSTRVGSSYILSASEINAIQAYRETLKTLELSQISNRNLLYEIDITGKSLINQSITLNQAQQRAETTFEDAERRFDILRFIWTTIIVSLTFLLFLLIYAGILYLVLKDWTIQTWGILIVSASFTAILLAYQVLGTLGAAVASIVVLLSMLVIIHARV